MCKIVEDYANEKANEASLNTAKEMIKSFFENGCSLDMVLASSKNIPEEIIRKIYEDVVGAKTVI